MQLFVASEGTDGIQKNLEVYSQGFPQGTILLTWNFIILKTNMIFILVKMNILICQY